MFESVLIANRGEIALRVIRTCRRLGIRTVAVFTDLDVEAPHVRAADDVRRVSSYLDIDAVLEAAAASGARAIHPGYGFLSENAAFARAVEAGGAVLVGPSADVMTVMARKDAAREVAVAAGVPVVPVSGAADGSAPDDGYPILVKAAAGGGGKGMRVVRAPQEYAEALAAAQREARASFGDDTMLLEKYVERGRHLEVQVFGDTHGHVVHLAERDCSVQRRHQKVVEEAPAPTITDAVRDVITAAAVSLAAHVGYTGAGTVEFLLDEDTHQAYFLEMNTRLQVEHPVTEAVIRVRGEALDLVELQLRVAAGEPLGFTQDEVGVEGHAIEARVYAEDAYAGFLPQAGTASLVRWPDPAAGGVRVDHALDSGQGVSTAYDPMLGKVIVHAADRTTAIRSLQRALAGTAILGLTTNVGFLHDLVSTPAFARAEIDTAWLDREPLPERPAQRADRARICVAWVQAMLTASESGHPFRADGFRLGADPAPQRVELDRSVLVDRVHSRVDDGSGWVGVRQVSAEDHVLHLLLDGEPVRTVVNVQLGGPERVAEAVLDGQRHTFTAPDRLAGGAAVPRRRHGRRTHAGHRARRPGQRRPAGGPGRGAGHPGGDEDGAHPHRAVRRHRHRGRGRPRGSGGAGCPALRGGARRMTTPADAGPGPGAAGPGHRLRGRPPRRPAERGGPGADPGQGGVRRADCCPPACRWWRPPASCTRSGCRSWPTPPT